MKGEKNQIQTSARNLYLTGTHEVKETRSGDPPVSVVSSLLLLSVRSVNHELGKLPRIRDQPKAKVKDPHVDTHQTSAPDQKATTYRTDSSKRKRR